jgi:hypothetical protein
MDCHIVSANGDAQESKENFFVALKMKKEVLLEANKKTEASKAAKEDPSFDEED